MKDLDLNSKVVISGINVANGDQLVEAYNSAVFKGWECNGCSHILEVTETSVEDSKTQKKLNIRDILYIDAKKIVEPDGSYRIKVHFQENTDAKCYSKQFDKDGVAISHLLNHQNTTESYLQIPERKISLLERIKSWFMPKLNIDNGVGKEKLEKPVVEVNPRPVAIESSERQIESIF